MTTDSPLEVNGACALCALAPTLSAYYVECTCMEHCAAIRCKVNRADGSHGLDESYRVAYGMPVFHELSGGTDD